MNDVAIRDVFPCIRCRVLLPRELLLLARLHIPEARPLGAWHEIVNAYTTMSKYYNTFVYQFLDIPLYCDADGQLDCYCFNCVQGISTVTVPPPGDRVRSQGQPWVIQTPLFDGTPDEIFGQFFEACAESWKRKNVYDSKQQQCKSNSRNKIPSGIGFR